MGEVLFETKGIGKTKTPSFFAISCVIPLLLSVAIAVLAIVLIPAVSFSEKQLFLSVISCNA